MHAARQRLQGQHAHAVGGEEVFEWRRAQDPRHRLPSEAGRGGGVEVSGRQLWADICTPPSCQYRAGWEHWKQAFVTDEMDTVCLFI